MKMSLTLKAVAVSTSAAVTTSLIRRAVSSERHSARARRSFNRLVEPLVTQPGENTRYLLRCLGRDQELRRLLADDKCWRKPRTVELIQMFLDSEPGFEQLHDDEINELLEIVKTTKAITGAEVQSVAEIVTLCDGLPVNLPTLEVIAGDLNRRAG